MPVSMFQPSLIQTLPRRDMSLARRAGTAEISAQIEQIKNIFSEPAARLWRPYGCRQGKKGVTKEKHHTSLKGSWALIVHRICRRTSVNSVTCRERRDSPM